MRFGAVGDDAGGDAEVGGVEGEDALDVREHKEMGGWGWGCRCCGGASGGGVIVCG